MAFFIKQHKGKITSIIPVIQTEFSTWEKKQNAKTRAWIALSQFKAESGNVCLLPDAAQNLKAVLLGLSSKEDFRAFGALPTKLPKGVYTIEAEKFSAAQLTQATLGFGLGAYQFADYKKRAVCEATLVVPRDVDITHVNNQLDAITLVRNLINTPAEDMGPEALALVAKKVATQYKAKYRVIVGDKLLTENYPTIYTVGRASTRAPRVIDIRWGNKKSAKKITLIGKGVCFDSGGLDIKSASGMLLMKKDMAGSAMMLALAQLIMTEKLPVQLRLLIGAVDNVISGNSYRPGDVIKTRSGKTVEITNTDAEGRLVLCDLITEASQEKPDLMVDFATLTGAARVALGEDLPALYTSVSETAEAIVKAGEQVQDLMWPMPLYAPYKDKLRSNIADMVNASESPWGGSITAALFLQAFVEHNVNWVHVDVSAWNFSAKPARPAGGEAFGVRALFHYIKSIAEKN